MSLIDCTLEKQNGAVLSECGRYRYLLWRGWNRIGDAGTCNWIMFNPSTADATEDDATIRRCVGFAKRWGYGAVIITNLFAFRATDPEELKRQHAPIGPENDGYLAAVAQSSYVDVVIAWGSHGKHQNRDSAVYAILRAVGAVPRCLKITKDGSPAHPVRLPYSLKPQVWRAQP